MNVTFGDRAAEQLGIARDRFDVEWSFAITDESIADRGVLNAVFDLLLIQPTVYLLTAHNYP
jgi:hypothetical protein